MKGDFCIDDEIIELLWFKESGINNLSVKVPTKTRTASLEKVITTHYCPVCGCRMYSKGVYRRKVNHPIMQDGLQLILDIHQHRCSASIHLAVRSRRMNLVSSTSIGAFRVIKFINNEFLKYIYSVLRRITAFSSSHKGKRCDPRISKDSG